MCCDCEKLDADGTVPDIEPNEVNAFVFWHGGSDDSDFESDLAIRHRLRRETFLRHFRVEATRILPLRK